MLLKSLNAMAMSLPDLKRLKFQIWLVSHRELNTSRRVRVVFDLLAAELARRPS